MSLTDNSLGARFPVPWRRCVSNARLLSSPRIAHRWRLRAPHCSSSTQLHHCDCGACS